MRHRLALLILVAGTFLLPLSARAQWQVDGTPISIAANDQISPMIVSDGAGGAIITWRDYRSGATNADIYVQRVNASGVPQWTADGVALCTDPNDQAAPTIVSDGAGGAIVTWYDSRSGGADIYVQRVNASGIPQWTANGVALCTATNGQFYPTIVSDGAGGAIVAWHDFRSFSDDIYARRVNAAGTPQWAADGVALCTAPGDQLFPTIVSDGAGGAIVTWYDNRSGIVNNNIYARRVNAAGTPQWTVDGVAICTAANDQFFPKIVSDGAGGAIITWYDYRSGPYSIYAQRVGAAGTPLWTLDGIAVCTTVDNAWNPTIAPDGAGGAFITWYDYRNFSDADIFTQRVSALGTPQWQANGVALCTAPNDQAAPTIVSDGAGGAIVTWNDYRNVLSDIYAQRVNASGTPLWTTDGVALCTVTFSQTNPMTVSDGAGGAIVTWQDDRSGGPSDVFAQRVEPDFGAWGQPEPLVTSVSDVPHDQGSKVAVNWKRSGHDALPLQEIQYYSVWRAVNPVALSSATSGGIDAWVDPSSIGPDFHGPAFSHERIASTDYYWEWIANQNATHDAGYSFAATTREDSVAGNSAAHFFRVLAHTNNLYVLYKSNAMSGHSVDNLAPAAPIQLVGSRAPIGDVVLAWKSGGEIPDLDHYNVYRSGVTGVTPTAPFFIDVSDAPSFDDVTAPTGPVHYLVTAVDIHGNESLPSNIVALFDATGTGGNSPPIKALTVLQNRPNPFTGSTDLEIGLPAASDVHVDVYDIAGRRVSMMDVKGAAAGWRSVPFAGLDGKGKPLASGVYFYKVTAHGTTVTNKMVIAR